MKDPKELFSQQYRLEYLYIFFRLFQERNDVSILMKIFKTNIIYSRKKKCLLEQYFYLFSSNTLSLWLVSQLKFLPSQLLHLMEINITRKSFKPNDSDCLANKASELFRNKISSSVFTGEKARRTFLWCAAPLLDP